MNQITVKPSSAFSGFAMKGDKGLKNVCRIAINFSQQHSAVGKMQNVKMLKTWHDGDMF